MCKNEFDANRALALTPRVRIPMTARRDPRRLTPAGKFWLGYLLVLFGGALWLAL